mmetsp:Transcript_7000/g.21094  ORF Transcript_7000/g.21094 Transcript_7000/m.21094 type:complete len:211 (-) Transcript_7000:93-725(-)
MNSVVSTRVAEASRKTKGALAYAVSPDVSRNPVKASMLAASLRRSVSSIMLSRMSDTTALSEVRASSGARNSSVRAVTYRKLRSAVSTSSTPGLSTLTATSRREPRSTARCTCATEAVASGVLSMLSKTSLTGRPSSLTRVRSTSAHGTGGALSRHLLNSSTYSAGKSVGLDAMNCPSLTYVAPSRSKSFRSTRGASACSSSRSPVASSG